MRFQQLLFPWHFSMQIRPWVLPSQAVALSKKEKPFQGKGLFSVLDIQ